MGILAFLPYLLFYVGHLARGINPVFEPMAAGGVAVLYAVLVWYVARAVRWARRTQPDIFGRPRRHGPVTDGKPQ